MGEGLLEGEWIMVLGDGPLLRRRPSPTPPGSQRRRTRQEVTPLLEPEVFTRVRTDETDSRHDKHDFEEGPVKGPPGLHTRVGSYEETGEGRV